MTVIQSYSGIGVTPLLLKPLQVSLEDIAHALSLKCRFTGHCAFHYSVAQHCLLGAEQLTDPDQKLAFMLHEVSEAYLPDIAAPIKNYVSMCPENSNESLSWQTIERQHARVVLSTLGVPKLVTAVLSEDVRTVDLRMLATERRDIMAPSAVNWNIPANPYHDVMIEETPWRDVKAQWLDMTRSLLARYRESLTYSRTL